MRREITDGGRESLYALLARALERVTEGLSGAADTPATLRRALAAMCAVVQAAWKLKPPVMPSISIHSPTK